ncbi:uncharacterized protein [Macrobrachium rosenbergii]|uniref:uncharacterized protein n=1 Tax=Macrobrachium rosenbergii TaxID=79674 RepID=UPI0034D791EA
MTLLNFGLFLFFPMGYALRLLQEPSDASSSYEERVMSFVPQIVGELVTGPLREKSVALVLPEGQDPGSLGHIDRPITLLRLPPASPDGGGEVETSNGTGNRGGGGLERGPLKVGVIVLVAASEDESWSLLQSPPENWNTSAVVLVSTSTRLQEDEPPADAFALQDAFGCLPLPLLRPQEARLSEQAPVPGVGLETIRCSRPLVGPRRLEPTETSAPGNVSSSTVSRRYEQFGGRAEYSRRLSTGLCSCVRL